jgi:hypothetical protein
MIVKRPQPIVFYLDFTSLIGYFLHSQAVAGFFCAWGRYLWGYNKYSASTENGRILFANAPLWLIITSLATERIENHEAWRNRTLASQKIQTESFPMPILKYRNRHFAFSQNSF